MWQRLVGLLYPFCLLASLASIGRGGAQTDRTLCERCQIVAEQLYSQLRSEGPKNDIDLRARLGDDGVRQGKIIKYRISEARVDALLEDLCPALKKYTFVDGAWGIRKGEETAADVHYARTLINTCSNIIHSEEERIAAWLKSDASEDPTQADVVGMLCSHTCPIEGDEPLVRFETKSEL